MSNQKLRLVAARQFDQLGLPQSLFKYRDWTDSYHKLIITNREVYLSPPTQFEDKKDCKNLIRYDLLMPRQIYSKYNSEAREQFPLLSWSEQVKIAEKWYDESPLHNKKGIRDEQEKDFIEFDKRFGVFCATPINNSNTMWTKYGLNHTGFCVGFNPEIFCPHFGGGGEVIYRPTLPVIMPTPYHDYDMQSHLQIYFKETKWSFENEYRLRRFLINGYRNEDRKILFPSDAYKEIIFGANMSDFHKNEIRELAKHLLPNVIFKQASVSGNKVNIKNL